MPQFFAKQQIFDSSKIKEFAEDNFEFDKNGRNFSKMLENTVGKGEIVLQTRKNKGLLEKELTL